MQGRHIKHAALRAYNAGERITMVTSFRARDPLIHDGSGEFSSPTASKRDSWLFFSLASVLSTSHPITKKNRINYQWTWVLRSVLSSFRNAPSWLLIHTLPHLSLYRMKLLSDRFQAMAAKLEEKKALLGVDDDADGQGGSEIVSCLLLHYIRIFYSHCLTSLHLAGQRRGHEQVDRPADRVLDHHSHRVHGVSRC
jgi:hypothetical protein